MSLFLSRVGSDSTIWIRFWLEFGFVHLVSDLTKSQLIMIGFLDSVSLGFLDCLMTSCRSANVRLLKHTFFRSKTAYKCLYRSFLELHSVTLLQSVTNSLQVVLGIFVISRTVAICCYYITNAVTKSHNAARGAASNNLSLPGNVLCWCGNITERINSLFCCRSNISLSMD